jgi:hypothetical protein
MYCVYSHTYYTTGKDDYIYGRYYNGTGWEPQEQVSTSLVSTYYWGKFSVVSIGDDVHVVFTNKSGDIVHTWRNHVTGSWSSEVDVEDAGNIYYDGASSPVLCKTQDDDLIAFWFDYDTSPAGTFCYFSRWSHINNTWWNKTKWFQDDSIYNADNYLYSTHSCSYTEREGKIGIIYRNGTTGFANYGVKFNYIDMGRSWVRFGENLSVTNNTFYQKGLLFNQSAMTYYWSVNATDGVNWTNATFHFTTGGETRETVQVFNRYWLGGNNTPAVVTYNATDIGLHYANLHGNITNNGGSPAYFGYEWGTTTGYGNSTGLYAWDNQSTGEYGSELDGNVVRIATLLDSFTGVPISTSYYLTKAGSPTGPLYARIRWRSNDTIAAEGNIDASTITSGFNLITYNTTTIELYNANIYVSIEGIFNATDRVRVWLDITTGQYDKYWGGWLGPSTGKLRCYFKYGTLNTSYTALDLLSNTLYHYRTYAENSYGIGYGNDVTFTTLGEYRNISQIHNYWWIGGDVSYRVITEMSNHWWIGNNGSTRETTNVFNYYWNGENVSRFATQVFNHYWLGANESILTVPTVTTNPATGVEETNATFNGYISTNDSTSIGFEYGTTTGYGSSLDGYYYNESTTLTLRPSYAGSYTQIEDQTPLTGYHWDKVDEVTSDDATTYCSGSSADGVWRTDTYNLQNHTSETGTILSVTYYYRWLQMDGSTNQGRYIIRTHSTDYNGATVTLPTSWTTYNTTFTTNPYISTAWTWNEIDTLEIGVGLRNIVGGSGVLVTQCYIVVNYVTAINYSNFYADAIDLSIGTLYHYRAKATNSNGTGYGSDVTLLTKPNPPTSLTTSSATSSSISLSWTKGTGANNTIIQRKTGTYPTTYTDGTNIYNGTSTSTIDNTVSPGIVYYYRAWSYTNWDGLTQYSDDYSSSYELTCPEAPTNAETALINSSTVTLTWTKGTNANNTIIIKSTTGIPSDITDGTTIYNGTGTTITQTYTIGETVYYRAWSYAYWTNPGSYKYSLDGTNFTVAGGGLFINCYDENTSTALTFNLLITNQSGTETYVAENCTNTHNINASLCPQGLVSIMISSTDYSSRIYYLTISPGIFYLLNAYLSQTNDSYIFVIQVIDDYNLPVSDALVTIKKYTNITETFDTISSQYTDGYGEIEIYLVPGTQYKVFIEKTGYTSLIADYMPDLSVRTKIFKINLVTTNPPIYDSFYTNIGFSSVMTGPSYMELGNITTTYIDSNSSTTDTDLYIYEYYNGAYTLLASYHNTSNSFMIITNSINTTRSHKAVLYFNNTADFIDVNSPLTLFIDSLYLYTNDTGPTQFNFDERVTPIVGPFTINGNAIPWSHVVAFGLGMAVLLLFGPFHVGIALIGCGMMIGFMDALFRIYLTDTFPVLLVTLCPVFIVLGVIYIMSKGGREHI